jgi:hypothetical protein
MAAQRKYPEELRDRAVKLVLEVREREEPLRVSWMLQLLAPARRRPAVPLSLPGSPAKDALAGRLGGVASNTPR